MCVLVLGQVVDCMKELLTQGQPVKLDGFGTFSPSVDAQKLGKANLADAVAGGPEAMINGIHINFIPENTKKNGIPKKEKLLMAVQIMFIRQRYGTEEKRSVL